MAFIASIIFNQDNLSVYFLSYTVSASRAMSMSSSHIFSIK